MTTNQFFLIGQWMSLLLVLVLSARVAEAGGSLSAVDPLADVKALNIEIVIGDAIRIDDAEASVLFGHDHEGRKAFEKVLHSRLSNRLATSGVEVREESPNHLLFAFFGGSSKIVDCQGKGVFLLEVTLTIQDEEVSAEPYSREVLGVFAIPDPAEALSLAASELLDDILRAGDPP